MAKKSSRILNFVFLGLLSLLLAGCSESASPQVVEQVAANQNNEVTTIEVQSEPPAAEAEPLPAVVIVSDTTSESAVSDADVNTDQTTEESAPETADTSQTSWRPDDIPAGSKFGRFEHAGETWLGLVLEDGMVQRLEGDLFEEFVLTDQVVPLDQLKVLAPVLPSKILAVGLNYRSHAGESGAGAPGLFSKFPNSLAGPDDPIWLFPESDNTHYEGELVIVIGKQAHNVSEADAPDYIFGVTAGNDITERTWQRTDLQWIRAKASDNFAPLGPFIVTGLNYNDLLVQTRVNGATTQSESSANLIHSVDKIVSYTSRYITLEPGDVIYTGTPGSTGAMSAGDVIEVEVEGVGILRNTAEPWDPNR